MVAFVPCPDELLVPLRRVLHSLPEIEEVQRPLTITFKVGRRNVAEVVSVRDGDNLATVMAARATETKVDVLARSGHPFFRPRGENARARIGVVLNSETDWTEILEVVTDSYMLVAPKRLTQLISNPETGR